MPPVNPPAADIRRCRAAIVELYEFIIAVTRNRVVHDLVDDDVDGSAAPRCWCPASVEASSRERRRAIGVSARRNAVGLRFKTHSVKHARVRGVAEINPLAAGAQREPELGLVERDERARRRTVPAGIMNLLVLRSSLRKQPEMSTAWLL